MYIKQNEVSFEPCRFLRFVRAHEKGGPIDEAAASEVQLTEEQIQEAGKQFGIDLKDAHELLAMRKTMPRDTFRDWVNACGYLQIVQNALVKGQYEDRVNGLWKQAVVRRYSAQNALTALSEIRMLRDY